MAEVKDGAMAMTNNGRAGSDGKSGTGTLPPRAMAPHEGAVVDRQTMIEEGTLFKGSLSSSCPIVVKGRIEGDVNAPALTVSNSGAVHGKVKVAQLRSQGEIAGSFEAESVQLSGVVKDKTVVRAQSLEVKLAPKSSRIEAIFGECELDVTGHAAQASTSASSAAATNASEATPRKASESPPSRASTAPAANGSSNGAGHAAAARAAAEETSGKRNDSERAAADDSED